MDRRNESISKIIHRYGRVAGGLLVVLSVIWFAIDALLLFVGRRP